MHPRSLCISPFAPAALSLFLLLGLAACGPRESAPPPPDATAREADHAAVRLENGVQIVEIEAGRMGYVPGEIRLQADVPARLIFTRTVETDCASQVRIPAFDVPVTDLPMHQPVVIEFTPAESGAFTFVCGMDMQRGALLVQS